MKQIFQNLKTGAVTIEQLPLPSVGVGQVLIQTSRSLVSLGTERMLVEFGKASWLDKARQQPEKVQQVITKIRTDGLMPTVQAVMSKLDQPLPLGYCNVGVVIEVGAGVQDLKVGDRVVSNGPHAEAVVVPRNLVAKIPDSVNDDDAAFTVLGSIGLQGIRLINPTLGETVVVVGLGLIGLLTVQLLKANGCDVIGFDFDPDKVRRANDIGAKAFLVTEAVDPVVTVLELTNQVGADSVVITASTKSNDVISQSAQMCRQRGRVVLVGVIGLDIKRSDFYEKEISFQVSCSYGPGRYDPNYEQKGLDFPIGFVRWTEQRNFEAILNLFAQKRLHVADLISKSIGLDDAPEIYSQIGEDKSVLGILIKYSAGGDFALKSVPVLPEKSTQQENAGLAILGAGQFATAVLLPALKEAGFQFSTLASRSGGLGRHVARKFDFNKISSDYDEVMSDSNISTVVISTRHNSHGSLVLKSLNSGKNVFVEKPLALKEHDLDKIEDFYKGKSSGPVLMVGFNRRFAPLTVELKKTLDRMASKKAMIMTVNAGSIPAKHWTQDPEVGGGRLVGEGCHFIDLLRFLSGSEIVDSEVMVSDGGCLDTFTIQLKFKNGDIGTIHYFANGSKSFPKERLEVFCGGKIFVLDNFKKLSGLGLKGMKYVLSRQDKGHRGEAAAFKNALQNGTQPIPIAEILEVSRVAIKMQKKIYKG
ncbi:bi-domain-containing oxidoreductase [Bdellovibrio bacteriovorus]|uniref:bi-domain-containing oxidoreductase n=1 Tax=Bdellovibrio bacteriovorus TaxID=959 RepID=UPI0035A9A8D0